MNKSRLSHLLIITSSTISLFSFIEILLVNRFRLSHLSYFISFSMAESTGSSYSPSIHSGSEGKEVLEVSFFSTRSQGSQMSISSQGSAHELVDLNVRQKRKAFSQVNKRRLLAKARKRSSRVPTSSKYIPAAESPIPVESLDTNILLSLGTMRSILDSIALCNHCVDGKLSLYPSTKTHGSASYITIACNRCGSSKSFWSSGSRLRGTITVGDTKIKCRSQLIYSSILSARLMGIGWAKLHLYHLFLNVPGPMSKGSFTLAQADILVAARVVADVSMTMAVNQLRAIHSVDASCRYVEVVGTFDGAYEQHSGKSGGGFFRYCFAAAIAAETGKVLAYGVACNSCAFCSALDNKLRDSEIDSEVYATRMAVHKPLCSAEYSEFSSVQLESAIAPKVIGNALARGVIFSSIVSDGDNKTHDVLEKAAVYQNIRDAPTIERFECIAHVAKRTKTNLHKHQEKVLKTAGSAKGAMSRALSQKGLTKKGKQEDRSCFQGEDSTV